MRWPFWLLAYLIIGLFVQLGEERYVPKHPYETTRLGALFVAAIPVWPLLASLELGYWMAKQADERRGLPPAPLTPSP